MFSYCKRTTSNPYTHVPYQYHMSPLQTADGFGKTPMYCQNINVPFVHNRGVPRNLLDLESKLKGQDKSVQPFCANPCNEKDLQFSTFKWLTEQPRPVGPIPCAPVPMIEVKSYGGSACNHVGGQTPCGNACGCSPRCQCKEVWRERNLTRPYVGQIGMTITPAEKFKF